MTDVRSLTIGNVTMNFEFDNTLRLPSEIDRRYSAFFTPTAPEAGAIPLHAHLAIDASLHWPGETFTPPAISMAGGIITIERSDLSVVLDTRQAPYCAQGCVMDSVFSFDTVMRLLLSETLLRHNGFLVHGCALDVGAGGALLHGVSGAGKSTLSIRAGLAATLTDELAIVRKIEECWKVFGTPFWGEFRHAGQARALPLVLTGAFVQPQNRSHHSPLAPAEALRHLARDIFCFNRDTTTGGHLLALASDLVTRVPQISFAFQQDETWESIASRLQSCAV